MYPFRKHFLSELWHRFVLPLAKWIRRLVNGRRR